MSTREALYSVAIGSPLPTKVLTRTLPLTPCHNIATNDRDRRGSVDSSSGFEYGRRLSVGSILEGVM
jgi:hypothetical protein